MRVILSIMTVAIIVLVFGVVDQNTENAKLQYTNNQLQQRNLELRIDLAIAKK